MCCCGSLPKATPSSNASASQTDAKKKIKVPQARRVAPEMPENIQNKLKYCGLNFTLRSNLFFRLANPVSALFEIIYLRDSLLKKNKTIQPLFRNKMEMVTALGKLITTSIGSFLWVGISSFIGGLFSHGTALAGLTTALHTLSLPVGTVVFGAVGATPIGLIILGSLLILGLGTAIAIGLYQQHYCNEVIKNLPPMYKRTEEPKKPLPHNIIENSELSDQMASANVGPSEVSKAFHQPLSILKLSHGSQNSSAN